uniref:ShKT domain-containing protein n=1 Tax=Romanomermis culicivorax TaxID=13658 RepID=A0A915IK52_ROMCU
TNHGYAEKEQPLFAIECRDNEELNCNSLRERGDCFGLASSVSKLCPRTCHFCDESRAHLPFSPEAEKISLWLQFYDNGKYAEYGRYYWQKKDFLFDKIVKKKCAN